MAQDPPNADAQGDGGLVVNYAGAPGDCYVTCKLTARDELPADQAANVVSRQWRCVNFDDDTRQNVANPAEGATTTSCELRTTGFYDVTVQRMYSDGRSDMGRFQFSVIKKQDAEAPVVIALKSRITTPAYVKVYTPKTFAGLDWFSGPKPGIKDKAKGAGIMVRRSGRIASGDHAGDYAYTFLVTAPRGKLLVRARARNPTSDNDDVGEARSVVTRFKGRPFQVLQKFAGLDTFDRPAFAARLVVLSRPATKWRTLLRVQERKNGHWGTFVQRRQSGKLGGYQGAQFDARSLEARSPLSGKTQARIARAMCAGRRYRVIGMFDVRDSHGKQLLSAKQRTITRSLPKLAGGGC
jgi:hypothetical protein